MRPSAYASKPSKLLQTAVTTPFEVSCRATLSIATRSAPLVMERTSEHDAGVAVRAEHAGHGVPVAAVREGCRTRGRR